jgi:16S rRNA (uracil1498-N3)-methyltransferase
LNHQKGAVIPIVLEMSILKGDAMEWAVEKAVELGVQKIVPVVTDYTVVQIQSKGPQAFQERWQKIADQSLKQCGRLDRLEISLPIPLSEVLTKTAQTPGWVRLWCDEASIEQAPFLSTWLQNQPQSPGCTWRILLGPEGGWSGEERVLLQQESLHQPNFRIHLGPLILRAETAALFTTSVVAAHIRAQQKL